MKPIQSSTRHLRLAATVLLLLATACDKPDSKLMAKAAETTKAPPRVAPAAPAAQETTRAHAAVVGAPGSSPAAIEKESSPSAETVELKSIVKRMFSRTLFKLAPSSVQAYFASIATLQLQPGDETWLQRFEGRPTLPFFESVMVELQEEDGHWSLGQSELLWRPPADQAHALYDRLVAEVQAARGRKPDFGDEAEPGKPDRSLGWTWCNDRCQAIVILDTDGSASLSEPSRSQNGPSVLLHVFTPEGP